MADRAIKNGIKIIVNIASVMAFLVLFLATGFMLAGIKPAIVVSGSMEPAIHTGSMVFVDTDERNVGKRDIIAFDSAGMTVIHRIQEVSDEGFVTKGDANETRDPGVVRREALKGKVVMWVPYAGYIAAGISSTTGTIIMLTVCIAMLLLYSATAKERRTDGRKKNIADSDCAAA